MPSSSIFAFDLDGTVTRAEILPAIAHPAGIFDEMASLTAMTLDGVIDFETSFRRRFEMLRTIPLATVQKITAEIPLDPDITAFIAENREICAIVTGNLDRWIEPLAAKLGCALYSSRSEIKNGNLVLTSIVNKGNVVRDLARNGKRVIAIGDAANDIPMFMAADIGIAYGGLRPPAPGLLAVANGVEHDAAALCRVLRQLRDTTDIYPAHACLLSEAGRVRFLP